MPQADDSYSAPASDDLVPGSYQDPEADLLPEYHKSEISLGLNNRAEVPRIDPYSTDFGEPLYIGTYTAAGSDVRPAVVAPPRPPTPAATYGVPAGPTLSDYNIQVGVSNFDNIQRSCPLASKHFQ